MSQLQSDIHEIEVGIEDAKQRVELGNALERLNRNADFRKVVIEGYFRDEASRLTLLSADRAIDESQRAAVMGSIRAVGEFHQYLLIIDQVARLAAEAIKADSETLDTLRASEGDGEDEDEGGEAEE